MPDITMCSNHQCPSSKICHRHEATPCPRWQSYSHFENDDQDQCTMFWPLEKEVKKIVDNFPHVRFTE